MEADDIILILILILGSGAAAASASNLSGFIQSAIRY